MVLDDSRISTELLEDEGEAPAPDCCCATLAKKASRSAAELMEKRCLSFFEPMVTVSSKQFFSAGLESETAVHEQRFSGYTMP